jgi:hypothetical protein
MAIPTSVITTCVIIAVLLFVIITVAIWQLCHRQRDYVQRNQEDAVHLRLNGFRSTEQLEVRGAPGTAA